ncbi:MAG TPA: hypothetical protein VM487_10035 [Phycisphaerae bacterium]|nr:hypothetical protein [Phycisphaerae bacterium]
MSKRPANNKPGPKTPGGGRDTGGPPQDNIPPWFARHLSGGTPLSAEVQAVLDDVIGPLYRRIVVEEYDPLLRSVGNAAVVAHTVEVLAQPEVLAAAKRAMDDPRGYRDEYVEVLTRYLKIAKERARVMQLHAQLRRLQRQAWPFVADPLDFTKPRGRTS